MSPFRIFIPPIRLLVPENPLRSQIRRKQFIALLLLAAPGVELLVLQIMMRWFLRQKSWRAALIKMAFLAALWLIVTFVFAAEVYLSTRGDPIKISWMMAASSAFRDWFPWILLSPLVIFLADKFRLERDAWGRSLAVHLAACLLFTAAYEELVTLASPSPVFLTAGGMGIVAATAPGLSPGVPAAGGFAGAFDGPPGASGSNTVFFRHDAFVHEDGSTMSFTMASNGVAIVHGGGPPSFTPPPGRMQVVLGSSFRPDPWTRFFHLAMMRTQFTFPIYWCIVCICWAIGHLQETGERERRTLELETRLSQARLQALKMQLQPHFLFNTLNAVSSLIHENPRAADDMIGSLSQFLRITLDTAGEDEVPLRAELGFVDRYLEIQQVRFGERLKICREVEPEVMDALVPTLILQPLVENAIRHGIEPCAGGGTVTIRAGRKNGSLRLVISDDGEGLNGGQLFRLDSGVGLSNTEARLQTLYGGRHQFMLSASVPRGASAEIEIPLRLSSSSASPQSKP